MANRTEICLNQDTLLRALSSAAIRRHIQEPVDIATYLALNLDAEKRDSFCAETVLNKCNLQSRQPISLRFECVWRENGIVLSKRSFDATGHFTQKRVIDGDRHLAQAQLTVRNQIMKKFLLVVAFMSISAPVAAQRGCIGYSGPGGPCYTGPGGGLYTGPGGGAYTGPGGGAYTGPGGGAYAGPGGGCYTGPGGNNSDRWNRPNPNCKRN